MDKVKAVVDGPTPVDSVREDVSWISGEYLSFACCMVARQYLDGEVEYEAGDEEKFAEDAAYKMRQHTPIAYSYFFQNYGGDRPLPPGTLDIILDYVRNEKPTFLGGKAPSGIFIPEGFSGK